MYLPTFVINVPTYVINVPASLCHQCTCLPLSSTNYCLLSIYICHHRFIMLSVYLLTYIINVPTYIINVPAYLCHQRTFVCYLVYYFIHFLPFLHSFKVTYLPLSSIYLGMQSQIPDIFSDIIVLTHVKMKLSQTETLNNTLLLDAQSKSQKIHQVGQPVNAIVIVVFT